jgi:hypothetical protein
MHQKWKFSASSIKILNQFVWAIFLKIRKDIQVTDIVKE